MQEPSPTKTYNVILHIKAKPGVESFQLFYQSDTPWTLDRVWALVRAYDTEHNAKFEIVNIFYDQQP